MAQPGQHGERHRRRDLRLTRFELRGTEAQLRFLVRHRCLLLKPHMGEVEVGGRHPHGAIGAGLAGVAVHEVVECWVMGLAREHEGEDASRTDELRSLFQPLQVEGGALRTAELQPVQHAGTHVHAVEPGAAQAREFGETELHQGRAEVSRREHDEVAQGRLGQMPGRGNTAVARRGSPGRRWNG